MLGRQSYVQAAAGAQERINTIIAAERQQTQGKSFWGSSTSYLAGAVILGSLLGLAWHRRIRAQ
jgi:hypothetical protein